MKIVNQPLAIIYLDDDEKNITEIHPADGYDHRHYGLIICDLVRHVAKAYHVPEKDVWEYVDKERNHPTTKFKYYERLEN